MLEPLLPASVAATQAAPAVKQQNMPIFGAITASKPRAFFFLGNNGMLPAKVEDYPVTHKATLRYMLDFESLMRRQHDMQELFRTTPCYAVQGERDFGCAGSDGRFVFAPEALLAFQRFWPNADWGTPEDPGCYSATNFGDVDVFLLDTRTYRTSKGMLGEPQLNWLRKGLKASKATFKVVASAATLWGDEGQTPEADSWTRYDAEKAAFLQWLIDNNIKGLVAVAGNQSAGQITKLDRTAGHGGYPLFSTGVSTLAALQMAAPEPVPNSHRMGAPVKGDTFATLDFTGAREHRTMTLRVHDAAGKVGAEQVVVASQLLP